MGCWVMQRLQSGATGADKCGATRCAEEQRYRNMRTTRKTRSKARADSRPESCELWLGSGSEQTEPRTQPFTQQQWQWPKRGNKSVKPRRVESSNDDGRNSWPDPAHDQPRRVKKRPQAGTLGRRCGMRAKQTEGAHPQMLLLLGAATLPHPCRLPHPRIMQDRRRERQALLGRAPRPA